LRWRTGHDLRVDPSELVNVADDPSYVDIRAGLSRRLSEFQQHYADTPYDGPSTPRAQWSWADEKSLRSVAEYAEHLERRHASD
jgi:choline-sulfatase